MYPPAIALAERLMKRLRIEMPPTRRDAATALEAVGQILVAELLAQERTDRIQGLICRGETADAADEPVRHPEPHVQLCVDARRDRPRDVAARVLEQDLLVADVD